MKYTIDEDICKKYNLDLKHILYMLLVKEDCNFDTIKQELVEKEAVVNNHLTERWDDMLSQVLLESDNSVPVKDRCDKLAEKMREMFPKGLKVGNSAWRGNIREISLRLQKFFKIYGNKWTDDEILDATKKYIESFNGDYTRMRILKYFILKFNKISFDNVSAVDEISDLATWLDSNTTEKEDNNWLTKLK